MGWTGGTCFCVLLVVALCSLSVNGSGSGGGSGRGKAAGWGPKGQSVDEKSHCSCGLSRHSKEEQEEGATLNAVILSATGRVGSSNLLSMLGSHPYIRDIGEIFIASKFHSLKLAPNINSPKTSPASPAARQRIIAHIKKSLLPSDTSVSPAMFVHRLASVKFWHAWENGVGVRWMVRHLRDCG